MSNSGQVMTIFPSLMESEVCDHDLLATWNSQTSLGNFMTQESGQMRENYCTKLTPDKENELKLKQEVDS